MRNGTCLKCSTQNVYFSNASAIQNGLKTGDGYPLLNIYKENRFIPDIDYLEMDYYVCGACGYFEMYVRDISRLFKLDESSNWVKL
jgi:predicted nucleic-acid-binding Zn-ribbon protein